jgi:hypothetical protein
MPKSTTPGNSAFSCTTTTRRLAAKSPISPAESCLTIHSTASPNGPTGSSIGSNSVLICRFIRGRAADSRLIDGAKLRAEFVVPHAAERAFFYGVNFELSFNAHYWEPTRNSGEIRPIIGGRIGPIDLITNPIVDTSFQGLGSLDFAPASRVAYNLSESWAVAVEHYADFGPLRHLAPPSQQYQALFAVIDYRGEPLSVEFGIGHGFTSASDPLILKLILSHGF